MSLKSFKLKPNEKSQTLSKVFIKEERDKSTKRQAT